MSLNQAIHVAEGYDVMNTHIIDAEKALLESLPHIDPVDSEKRAEFYYYLLILLLKRHITFENPLAHNYFERMQDNLEQTERAYKAAYRAEKDKHRSQLIKTQMKAFYKIVERYFMTLETAYEGKGFMEARERAYEGKLNFRISRFALEGRWGKWAFLSFFRATTNFGLSVGRLSLFLLISIVVFAILYAVSDVVQPAHVMIRASEPWFDYIYFSTITLTSLGYGDIVAITIFQKLIVCVEILAGYVILGLFIHFISKRL